MLGARTFGSWHVDKLHAVVVRSTFPSQNVYINPPCSEQALLEVDMSKTCTSPCHFTASLRPGFGQLVAAKVPRAGGPIAREPVLAIEFNRACMLCYWAKYFSCVVSSHVSHFATDMHRHEISVANQATPMWWRHWSAFRGGPFGPSFMASPETTGFTELGWRRRAGARLATAARSQC